MATAVIFDMDGVIVDTEPGYFRCINEVLKPFGKHITKKENEAYIGTSNQSMWRAIIHRLDLNTTVAECEKKLEVIRERLIEEEGMEPIDGTLDLIKELHQAQVPLAIASSSPMEEIKRVTKLFEIESYFRVLMTGEDCVESKPHPEIFERAAKGLQVPANHCLVIEDSQNGVIAAKKAGMKAIGYCNPDFGATHLKGADMEVDSIGMIDVNVCKSL